MMNMKQDKTFWWKKRNYRGYLCDLHVLHSIRYDLLEINATWVKWIHYSSSPLTNLIKCGQEVHEPTACRSLIARRNQWQRLSATAERKEKNKRIGGGNERTFPILVTKNSYCRYREQDMV